MLCIKYTGLMNNNKLVRWQLFYGIKQTTDNGKSNMQSVAERPHTLLCARIWAAKPHTHILSKHMSNYTVSDSSYRVVPEERQLCT